MNNNKPHDPTCHGCNQCQQPEKENLEKVKNGPVKKFKHVAQRAIHILKNFFPRRIRKAKKEHRIGKHKF
jgi:hypothetical protein